MQKRCANTVRLHGGVVSALGAVEVTAPLQQDAQRALHANTDAVSVGGVRGKRGTVGR